MNFCFFEKLYFTLQNLYFTLQKLYFYFVVSIKITGLHDVDLHDTGEQGTYCHTHEQRGQCLFLFIHGLMHSL